ncbi:MFS general substrate transporter [Aaosphaeria arxii CBS 175.79]|uniref:MFS general substrate transporter n=1 Tax=Aaosphaeria arxii CBS 175.79 TaxID=1450172 RepID=A0A6A5Y334_9PLEO|nr:MFS general substrate transporter [Aaosphaeria arxii CBS 175.79]KAF2019457.1 MFS general substrate transporter [Aaosphaeria arxii CBS 175.79]
MGGTSTSNTVHELQRTVGQWDLGLDTTAQTEPPTDGGQDAWLVLTSSFILGAIVWGFPYSFGIFQEYYLRQEKFSGSHSGVAAIGTTAMGIIYLTAPALYVIIHRYYTYRKMISLGGFVIMLMSLLGASFAKTVSQLLVNQGLFYALGGAMLYFPVFNYVDEWFIKRRGLAYGALIAGDGAGGVVIPFVMEWILNRWGFQTALRTWAIVCLLLVTPALVFLKDYPVNQNFEHTPRKVDLRFLKTKAFWILQTGNMLQSLGYLMPSYYLPSFAVSRGWSPFTGTIAVSLCNAAIVFGTVTIGWLCDRHHVTVTLMICTIGTLLAVFVFWGFSVYQPVMYTFAIAYGFFAGGFPATWAGCSHPVRRTYPVETGMIIALFTAGKGVSSVVSGPLGGLLASSDAWKGHVGYAYGSGFGYLIVFSGVTASFGSLGWIGRKFGWIL